MVSAIAATSITTLSGTVEVNIQIAPTRKGPIERNASEFQKLTEAYFAREQVAKGVLLLVDSRHPGLESDLEAWRWLQGQPVARGIVGTKVDKLTRAERMRHAREFESLFQTPVLLVSVQTGEGLDELWKMIASLPRQTVA